MLEQPYNTQVRELFVDLNHAGLINAEHNPLQVTVGAFELGAQVSFFVVAKQSLIERVRYQAYGCPHFLAACEWLARRLAGQPFSELSAVNWRQVERVLEVPANKRSRLLLLDDVMRQLQCSLPLSV